jgi:ActR/RegA family two-component response regulator
MELNRILLVDDDDAVRTTLAKILEMNGFDVVAASNVGEALTHIAKETFDVLLTDLHMPGAGDGMTVVSAMRHSHPAAVTLVFSGYPEMEAAMSAILLQADEILVKPLEIPALVQLIQDKILSRKVAGREPPESVATILERDADSIVRHWLHRVEAHAELTDLPLTSEVRTGHLPQLLKEIIVRLHQPQLLDIQSSLSSAAVAHGRLRYEQRYTAALMIEESRMLQVSIFEALQRNIATVDFSLLLADVMTIADEVDSQLAQSMRSYVIAESSQKAA